MEEKTNWIISCNPHFYDINGAFKEFNIIPWCTRAKINIGDIVYLYISKPIKEIRFKCEVVKNDVPLELCDIDDDKYYIYPFYKMNKNYIYLKLVHIYNPGEITRIKLNNLGCTYNFQGPYIVKKSELNLLKSYEKLKDI